MAGLESGLGPLALARTGPSSAELTFSHSCHGPRHQARLRPSARSRQRVDARQRRVRGRSGRYVADARSQSPGQRQRRRLERSGARVPAPALERLRRRPAAEQRLWLVVGASARERRRTGRLGLAGPARLGLRQRRRWSQLLARGLRHLDQRQARPRPAQRSAREGALRRRGRPVQAADGHQL